MNSKPISTENQPPDAPVPRADEQLAHAHGQITRASEELARMSERVARMEHYAERPPSAGPPPPGTPSAGPRPQSTPPGRSALRALVGLVLAACLAVATLVWHSTYGAGFKPVVAPQLASTLPSEDPPAPARPAASIVQVAAEARPPQPTPLPQTAPQEATPTSAAALPDHTELLQTMARDLANLQRSIEELKANQQQLVRDNSKTIEELKANQEEMKRALAKVSEQNPPKTSPPPAQPTPTLRKPERTVQSPHARAPPRFRREWIYDDEW